MFRDIYRKKDIIDNYTEGKLLNANIFKKCPLYTDNYQQS